MNNNLDSIVAFSLPDEQSQDVLLANTGLLKQNLRDSEINFDDNLNILHNTIYQGLFSAEALNKLDKEVNKMAKRHAKFITHMRHPVYIMHNLHVFFDIIMNDKLQNIYDYFFDNEIFKLRSPGLIAPIENSKHLLNTQQLQIAEKYGCLFNTPEFGFYPHFTLIYNIDSQRCGKKILQCCMDGVLQITFDRIGIGKVGKHGNLEEILQLYELQ